MKSKTIVEGVAMPRVNSLIVNYRTPELTLKCVSSILDKGVSVAEDIIVVENASPDDSAARLRDGLPAGVQLVVAERNGGFSSGINVGAAHATAPFLLVLNPDTYFINTSISKALDRFKDSEVGLVGLDLTYPNGERQYSARRFYSVVDIVGRRTPLGKYWPLQGRIAQHMMLSAWKPGTPFEADWVMGTGFIIRRELFEAIGRMDEDYFLYMEDVDLCARVWASGSKVECVPGAVLIHDHQRASQSGALSKAGRMHLESLGIFRRKHRLPLFVPPSPNRIKRGGVQKRAQATA